MSLATRDDGDLQMGAAWPNPRFTDNEDGTVTDNMTGLIWLKNADCYLGAMPWNDALTFANLLHDGWTGDGSVGDCDLSDGSLAGVRIPTDPATSFRLIPPPYSDPKRHPIPKHSATPERGNLSDAG
jgi:hypothetical protein